MEPNIEFDLPEKPKRRKRKIGREEPPTSRRKPVLMALLLALVLALPVSIVPLLRYQPEQLLDLLLIGVMICAALYLVLQASLWALSQLGAGWHADDEAL